MHGMPTSEIEVSGVSSKGFWMLLGDEELFVPFSDFPWFKQATIAAITTVEMPSSGSRVLAVAGYRFIDSIDSRSECISADISLDEPLRNGLLLSTMHEMLYRMIETKCINKFAST